MLELRELRMVRCIHEHGSLARAARVLSVSQPSLTRSLASVEARLRGALFERNRRGMVATDLCRALLPEADDVLARMETINRRLREGQAARLQTLAVVGGHYAMETFGVTAAARMLAAHPTLRITLASTNWTTVPRAVREREASIGVLDLGELADASDLTVEPLPPHPGIFVVRPAHPLIGMGELRLSSILAWPLVFVGHIPRRVQEPMTVAREQARLAGHLHPAFPALVQESPTVSLTAVKNSDAVAAMTVPIAITALRAGEVVALPWRESWLTLQSGIIRRRHNRGSEVEDAFVDLLRIANREAETMAFQFLADRGICDRVA